MTLSFDEAIPSAEEFCRLFETTGWNARYRASSEELMGALAHSQWMVSCYEDGALVGFGRVVTDGFMLP